MDRQTKSLCQNTIIFYGGYGMSKAAIIFYSQTGNTEELAKEIAAGVRAAGGEAYLLK